MDSPFDPSLRLQNDTETSRHLILKDLDLILAFATITEKRYSMGKREHAERSLAIAEKGYSDLLGFFSQARSLTPEVEREIQSKFSVVRERLDTLAPKSRGDHPNESSGEFSRTPH